MKRKSAATRANAIAVGLLLSASIVYHAQQAIKTRSEKPASFTRGLQFTGSVCSTTLLPSFSLFFLPNQTFNHHKPI